MSKCPPLSKLGCTFDEYHSLLKHCHRQRHEVQDDTFGTDGNNNNVWAKIQQQQQPAYPRTTPPSFASIEDIPYEYLEQQTPTPPKDRSSPESWGPSPRFSSKSYQQGSQPEQVTAFDSWGINTDSNSLGFDSWAPLKSPAKTRPTHSWNTETAHIPRTTTQPRDLNQNRPDHGTDQTKVKLIKPERFKDIQMEAINHWTNGIDLDLEKPPQKKDKKSGWLTIEELAKFSSTKREPVAYPMTRHLRSTPPAPPQELKPVDIPPVINSTGQQPTNDNNDLAPALVKLVSNLPKSTYLLLDTIQNHGFGAHYIPAFTKALPHILSNLPNENNRTFKKLVSTILMILDDSIKVKTSHQPMALSDKQPIMGILHDFTLTIMDAATRYIQSYVITPSHFKLMLNFFLFFSRERLATVFPLYILHERYNQLRDLFLPESCKEIQQRLMQLETYTTNSMNQTIRPSHQVAPRTYREEDHHLNHRITEKEPDHSLPSDIKNDHVRQYLQQQLEQHRQYLTSLKERATQLVMVPESSPESNWVILRNARYYPPMVFAPVIPDTAVVYSCDYSNQLNTALIGCIAIVIPTTSTQEQEVSMLIGTTIQYANDDEGSNSSLVVVKHGEEYIGYDKTYTLVLTSIKATDLLPLVDWLDYACSSLNESDFSPDLITTLLTVEKGGSPENTSGVPDYLLKLSLDVSNVMTPNYRGCKANVSENSWPQLQSKHLRLPPDRRPLVYTLSPSQVSCLQYALSHRFSVVLGGPGTGKTFLAGKLLELCYQALKKRYIHQPILVMAPTTTALESLLGSVAHPPLAQDMVFFGDDSDGNDDDNTTTTTTSIHTNRLLSTRDGLQLSMLSRGSAAWKKHRHESRELEACHMKIRLLEQHRQSVIVEQDSSHVVELMPPSYRDVLITKQGKNAREMGQLWLRRDDDDEDNNNDNTKPVASIQTYSRLLGNITHGISSMQPIMKRADFLQQQQWMDTHPLFLQPLSEGRHWPFQSTTMYDSYFKTAGDQARLSLYNVWALLDPVDLWQIPLSARRQLYEKVLATYAIHINKVLKHLTDQQDTILVTLNNLRISQWQSTCTFNRVVGMTTGFAMANQAFVRTFSPHVVIIDDAQCVSGAFLAATGAISGAEHLILLGGDSNGGGGGGAHVDSFLDQWRRATATSPGTLTDQWRMEPEVFDMWRTALGQEKEETAISSMKNKKKPEKRIVRGMKTSTCLVSYSGKNHAKFVAHLALYLYQQDYATSDLLILTGSIMDQLELEKCVAQLTDATPFSAGFGSVLVDCVDTFKEKERDIVILFVNSVFSLDQVSTALSSARKALYIVGEEHFLTTEEPWIRLVDFMKHQGLYSDTMLLQCQKHLDAETRVAHHDDFSAVKNGGCLAQCRTLMTCGHVCQENCHHRSHSLVKCQQPCERPRSTNCPHSCKNKCYECQTMSGCPPCIESFNLLLACDHRVNILCSQQQNDLSKIQCHELVPVTLGCGHTITTECYKVGSAEYAKSKCNEMVKQQLECGHTVQTECGDSGVSPTCIEQCSKSLECGHPCQQMCYSDHDHDRKQCSFGCPKQLICGHQCAKGCANPDNHTERCLKTCERLCSHGYKCDRMCWEACIKCLSSCPNQCLHSKCAMKCYEICDRKPCDEPCTKILECSHPCKSTCGEPCSMCPICHADTQCSITLRPLSEFSPDEKIYTLPDCGCSFSLEGLDMYFASRSKNGDHTAIKQRICPSCQKPVYTASRYSTHVKTELNLIDAVKEHQEQNLQQLTDEERYNIINAMNEESMTSINNIVGGRWFVCKNQHPYFIGDCGGATEVSKCPQCNEAIGGLQHKVIDTNRFYGEFDGSAEPAWPGQRQS